MADRHRGRQGAASEISAIKIAVPATAQWVIDKAIGVHGAAGVSADYPLAMLWAQARSLRFADGPDEVHRMVPARRELRRYRSAAPGRSPTDLRLLGVSSIPRLSEGARDEPAEPGQSGSADRHSA